jgi:hypothetical protein
MLKNSAKSVLVIATGICLVTTTLALDGQSVSLSSDASPTLRNAFPVDFSYLVWHHNPSGFVDAVAVSTVKAKSSTTVSVPSGSILQFYEPVSLAIPRAKVPPCIAGGRLPTHSEQIKLSMAKLEDAVNSPEAQAVIANAVQLAQVDQAQLNEEMDVYRKDPLRRDAEQLKESMASPGAQGSMQYDEVAVYAVEAIGMLVGIANVYAAKAAAHDQVSKQEAEALKRMLSNEKEEIAKIDTTYGIAGSEVKAFEQYVSGTAAALSSLYTTDSVRVSIRPASGISRTCGTTAGAQDYVQFQAEAPPEIHVVMARARFDHGGVEATYFRRIQRTNVWIAPLVWPLDAGSASAQIQDQNTHQWIDVSGSVNPGRPPVSAQLKQAKDVIGKLNKLYHNASFSGEGGDGHRTVFLP